jgi:hypothetical protein
MKTIAIIQPSFLPWRGYFQIISQCDDFIFYDNVQYDRRGWRNRNQIKSANGLIWLTVPTLTKGKYHQLINETEIDNSVSWQKKILTSIRCSYGKSPFFDPYFTWLSSALGREWRFISDLDMFTTEAIAEFLKIKTRFHKASDLSLSSKEPAEKLVEICNFFSAQKYISGPSAKGYIGEGKGFVEAQILLEYASYDLPAYPQVLGEFNPYVSVLDLLFNMGPESYLFL